LYIVSRTEERRLSLQIDDDRGIGNGTIKIDLDDLTLPHDDRWVRQRPIALTIDQPVRQNSVGLSPATLENGQA
jgi:hypothetical protein